MPYSNAKILKYSSLAFIFGIVIGSWTRPVGYELITFSLAELFFIVFFALGAKKKIAYSFLLFGFILIGLWRYEIALPQNDELIVSYYNGQSVELTGRVVGEPDIRENNTKLTVKVDRLNKEKISGKILLTTENYPQYNYGDNISAQCKLEAPEEFNGFAYDRYLSRYDIYSVCYYPEIKLLAKAKGSKFLTAIFRVKNRLRSIINLGLGEPQAILVNAIILGDKKGLPVELQTAFSRSGLSHIIAISGMNISILVVIIMSSLIAVGLSRQKAFYFAVTFFAIYILLVGFPASALRAGVMGFLALWAIYLGRLNRFDYSLILAAAVMLVFNPKLFRDDIGFQLSFLAMAGIAYFYPLIGRLYEKSDFEWLKKILDIINMTIAAQLLTWPIIVYNFHVFSLIAPIANLLVLWTLPLQMSFTMAALGLGSILPAWAVLYFLPVNILTTILIMAGTVFSEVPFGYLLIESLRIEWLIVYYVSVIILVLYIKRTDKIKNPQTVPVIESI